MPVPKFAEPSVSSVQNSEAERHQKENNILDLSPIFALEDTGIKVVRESAKLTSDKTNTKTASSEKHASKKRKELDDLSEDTEALEIVFGSRELDWEGQMADHDQEAQRKKKFLETKGSRIQEVNVKQREENKILVSYILLVTNLELCWKDADISFKDEAAWHTGSGFVKFVCLNPSNHSEIKIAMIYLLHVNAAV